MRLEEITDLILAYLEAIYTLQAEGEEAFGVTLADMFGVSRANASATLQRMARDGLVLVDGRHIALTDLGRQGAESGLRRHSIAERFLVDVLRLDWATVHAEARSFERGLTTLLEERMDQRLGLPRTCPHGNPVPRPDLDAAGYLRQHNALRLSEAPVGEPLTILAISELIEHRTDLLRFSAQQGLQPGAQVRRLAPADGTTHLSIQGVEGAIEIEATLAARLWVTESGGPVCATSC